MLQNSGWSEDARAVARLSDDSKLDMGLNVPYLTCTCKVPCPAQHEPYTTLGCLTFHNQASLPRLEPPALVDVTTQMRVCRDQGSPRASARLSTNLEPSLFHNHQFQSSNLSQITLKGFSVHDAFPKHTPRSIGTVSHNNSSCKACSQGANNEKSHCDEMSCCKSYLGNNNEVRMTSNLPECWFRFFIMFSFLVIYMCIGAAAFSALEREHEQQTNDEILRLWEKFEKDNDISPSLLQQVKKLHYESCDMEDPAHLHNQTNIKWDYISSLFFTGTVLTTIGYGHTSPSTDGGRIFTIFYAVFGIPFMLGLLNVVAEILLTTLKALKSKIKKKPCSDVFHHEVFLSALLWVIMLLVVMTLIFKAQEDGNEWTYGQSIYFSFITMTTIGFGDYVPAQGTVKNDSPGLIATEFFNMVLIFISVLIWYFLSQVSAQVLKVRLKKLYGRWSVDDKLVIANNIEPVMPERRPPSASVPPDHCTCPCTCGYIDKMEHSVSSYSVYSNFDKFDNHNADKGTCPSLSDSLEKRGSFDHIVLNNLESIQDDTDTELDLEPHCNIDMPLPKIPSIVITPVEVLHDAATLHATCFPDSGTGSSEMYLPDIDTPQTLRSSESTGSLDSLESGICSVRGTGMRRSHSADMGRDHVVNYHLDFPPTIRNSRSLCELRGSARSGARVNTCAACTRGSRRSQHSCCSHMKSAKSLQSFHAIHTQLFDDMMK